MTYYYVGQIRGAPSRDGGVVYGGVYVCLVIPGLVIGTIGGGTQLATQKECLAMMGCYGKVNTHEGLRSIVV